MKYDNYEGGDEKDPWLRFEIIWIIGVIALILWKVIG